MKKLFLIRHAKSDWNNAVLQDIERPLNERGYNAAHFMSERLRETPDLIITSPAIRAASTALIFARHLNYNANNIIIKQELYDTNVKEYLSVIKKMDNACHSLMLFGHNPIISDFADSLIDELPMEMPTCAIAGIEFKINAWSDLKPKSGELFLFNYPKKDE